MEVRAYLEITMKISEETRPAAAYLKSEMFNNDVFVVFKPLWSADPDVKIYTAA